MFAFFRVVGNRCIFIQRDKFSLLDFVERVIHSCGQVDVLPVRGLGEYPVQPVCHGHPVIAGFVFVYLFIADVRIVFFIINGLPVVQV